MAPHPDLRAEQAFIDRAYGRIDALRAAASERLASVLQQRGATPGSLAERDVVVRTTLSRLEQLDVGRESLCFGRIDREDGDSFHIGRLAVSAEDQEPLVVDWRAPVAEPFYRATGVHPMGLRRRRHFATEGRRLLGIEDELFGTDALGDVGDGSDARDAGAPEDDLTTSASGALMAALGRARSGRMRDIVATVQREQDEVIRAELPGVLVVQGGPGTGKTAVALHRAAYLLYTHRFPLERQGVLLIGPNPLFLRYIEQVLPSLGESGVALTTVAGLVHDVRARAEDTPEVARIKGGARMARLVAQSVRDRQRPLRRDLAIAFEGFVLRVGAATTRDIVRAARRRPVTHNARRRFVEVQLSRRLLAEYREVLDRRRRAGYYGPADDAGPHPAGDDAPPEAGIDEAGLWASLRRLPPVAEALDRMWPVLDPRELLHDLYGARPLLALAGRGILTDDEVGALCRSRSAALEEIPWTPGDLALLDEARLLLGPRVRRRRRVDGATPNSFVQEPDDEIRGYGHIVVDEAQDLTPMQLRMLARRSISGSMTVVGDIAQATGPLAPAGWSDVVSHLPARRPARVVELSVNYRTPARIMALAARVLAVAAPHLPPPRSVRDTADRPQFSRVEPAALGDAVAAAARLGLADAEGGNVAVIVTDAMAPLLAQALSSAGLDFGRADRDGLEARLTVIPVGMVKGLEFDSVIVVEPARLVAESPQGLRALYVALTRATRRLSVVHAEPLPVPLDAPEDVEAVAVR